jgi:hypothetical protein
MLPRPSRPSTRPGRGRRDGVPTPANGGAGTLSALLGALHNSWEPAHDQQPAARPYLSVTAARYRIKTLGGDLNDRTAADTFAGARGVG